MPVLDVQHCEGEFDTGLAGNCSCDLASLQLRCCAAVCGKVSPEPDPEFGNVHLTRCGDKTRQDKRLHLSSQPG